MLASQKILELILQNENKATEEGMSLYDEILNSKNSVKHVINRRRPHKVEVSKACSALLLYRTVDAIAFSKGYVSTGSTIQRGNFPTLTIPVWSLLICSVLPLSIKINLGRADRRSVMAGPISYWRLEIRYMKLCLNPKYLTLILWQTWRSDIYSPSAGVSRRCTVTRCWLTLRSSYRHVLPEHATQATDRMAQAYRGRFKLHSPWKWHPC